jgi:hypothetical protein
VSCGILAFSGLIYFLARQDSSVSYYSYCLASINFLCLFFGLRVSKDYRGAAGLIPYFIVALLSIYFTH